MVRQTLFEQFQEETYTRGFEVITSIVGDKQLAANRALVNGLENYYDKPHGYRGPMPTIRPPLEIRHPNGWSIWRRYRLWKSTAGHCHKCTGKSLLRTVEGRHEIDVPRDGIRWAYAFRSRNEAWPPPQVAGDAVQVGDLIRVKLAPDHWELGQVPDIQGALVSVSPDNGRILALVGGYDFR